MAEYQDILASELGREDVKFVKAIFGGIINKAALYESVDKQYFVKYNSNPETLAMFHSERASLELLEQTNIIRVPKSYKVIALPGDLGALHVMEFIPDLRPMETRWSRLGEQIARLHTYNSDLLKNADDSRQSVHTKPNSDGDGTSSLQPVTAFGSQHPPFFGMFTPGAVWRSSWTDYFIRDLLKPQFDWIDKQYNSTTIRDAWSYIQLHVHKILEDTVILPDINHGDLCPINFGETETGTVLFDPSCIYGHREFETSLDEVEGGFHHHYHMEYRRCVPRVKGWEERSQLYCLFVHTLIWNHENNATTAENAETAVMDMKKLIEEKMK